MGLISTFKRQNSEGGRGQDREANQKFGMPSEQVWKERYQGRIDIYAGFETIT